MIGRIPFVALEDVDKVEAWFLRHGYKAVFLGRLLPLFRSLVSIPDRNRSMPVLPFLGLALAGSLVWNSVLIVAGYFLGENWTLVEEYAGMLQVLVIAGCAVLAGVFVAGKIMKARSKADA
ncbi:DedA family protein [Arthrobacter sp. UC242_113]|uniref:DedA family protein n=1 Tax=Arthrobacter sp. UC242_113 TaxID=3374550 RepID=UPI0037580072